MPTISIQEEIVEEAREWCKLHAGRLRSPYEQYFDADRVAIRCGGWRVISTDPQLTAEDLYNWQVILSNDTDAVLFKMTFCDYLICEGA